MNGSNYERKFATLLNDRGFHVIRAPASGAATTRDLPDLAYSKPGATPTMIELKATSQNVAYYSGQEVEALQNFALAFNGRARLAARFKQDTSYYLSPVGKARVTDSGRFAVDREIDGLETIDP